MEWLILLINTVSTSLTRPPFVHNMGYNRATPFELKMILGKSISFQEPQCITTCKLDASDNPKTEDDDDELNVYCTNSWANQIVYNVALKKIKTYGKLGSGTGEFWNPRGITVNPQGDLYVADLGNNRIVRLKDDIDSLRWVTTIGHFGGNKGEFDQPYDVAIDSYKRIWVTDKGNNRIQIFNDSSKFVKEITGLVLPTGIAVVDEEENWARHKNNFLVVIDDNGRRIQKFDLDGKLLAKAEFQLLKLDSAYFKSVAIDYIGNIWVTDKINRCVHKFDRLLRYLDKIELQDAPRGIGIWRRYGQVFIVSREAIDYYWIGVDGFIEGCYPKIFDSKEKGVTISIYITEPAEITSKIYDSNNKLVRNFISDYTEEALEHNIVWDGKDNSGNPVKSGEYKIEMMLEPTYSSRGFFKKILRTSVTAK
ncbi:MAG: FlgD immunoglobulin-like domain containing protein [bacterium]|nr:FlgD immunoglobulin-like domain containing protein [bacterium]